MFFSITPKPQSNYSHFYHLGPFVVSTDAGWQRHDTDAYSCIYKGYADNDRLFDLLDQIATQTEPQLFGNFCMIVYNNASKQLQVKSDRWRSFPLYFDKNIVTNLLPRANTAWTDSLLTIEEDFSIKEDKFDVVGSIDTTELTFVEVINLIDKILLERTQNFIKNNILPVRVFLSGGVDSLLVYSYLEKFTNNYKLVKGLHIDFDRFWLMNHDTIKKNFWGYTQIHHWNDPCILTSGAPGDEFMLRSPVTADLFLKFHNYNIIDLLEKENSKYCLHRAYFQKPANYQIFKTQTVDPTWTREQLFWNLCNIIVNDWQHWHIGNTLTWTPLRDLEIFKLMLRLPLSDTINQIMDSGLSKQLIEHNQMGLSQLISTQKNSGNYMSNLCDFYCAH